MPQVPLTEFVLAAQTGDRLLSFPTDTVPALAARPERADLIFAAKQRSYTKPLILMGATPEDLWPYVQGSKAERHCWQQVMDQYWPGALTLVLPASPLLPIVVNPMDPSTVGIRIPNSAIARHILAQTKPLATTSVNQSGYPPLQTMAAVEAQFPNLLTLLPSDLEALAQCPFPGAPILTDSIPANPSATIAPATNSGIPSTVAKWTGQGWNILRQGSIVLPAANP